MSLAVEAQSLNHWTTREVSTTLFMAHFFFQFIFSLRVELQDSQPCAMSFLSGPHLPVIQVFCPECCVDIKTDILGSRHQLRTHFALGLPTFIFLLVSQDFLYFIPTQSCIIRIFFFFLSFTQHFQMFGHRDYLPCPCKGRNSVPYLYLLVLVQLMFPCQKHFLHKYILNPHIPYFLSFSQPQLSAAFSSVYKHFLHRLYIILYKNLFMAFFLLLLSFLCSLKLFVTEEKAQSFGLLRFSCQWGKEGERRKLRNISYNCSHCISQFHLPF